MSKWTECKLKDVAEKFAMGPFGSNIKAENFINSGVPVIRGTNLNFYKYVDGEFVFLTEEKADQLKSSNCFPGDLVFTHRGTLGQVGIVPNNKYKRYVISQSGMKVTVNNNLVDNHFLFYFFKSSQGQHELLQHESQVGVPSISNPLTSLKSVSLSLPSLPEQHAIASMLSRFDDKIDLLHRQNKIFESMAETLFRQWFVKDADAGWEEGKLSDIISVKYGKDHKKLTEGTIPAYGSGGIMRYVDTALYSKESVLIPRKGTLNNIVYINEPFWTVDTMFYTEMKTINIAKYVYLLVKLRDLASMNVGSAVPSMTTEILNNMEIIIPPTQILEKFELTVKPLFIKQKTNHNQIQTLKKLRDMFLPKLLNGEVKIIN